MPLRSGAGIHACIAVPVRDEIRVEPVVGDEAQEPVLPAPARDDAVEPEAVGLDHVDVVEVGVLDGEVAQHDSVGAVGADHVELVAVAVEEDVRRVVAGALDLDVALPENRDEVLVVRTALLVRVARDEHRRRRVCGHEQIGTARVAKSHRPARFLAIHARKDENARPRPSRVDRRLHVLVAALRQEREAAAARSTRQLRDPRPGIGLADHERGTGRSIGRDGADVRVGERGRPLVVRERWGGEGRARGGRRRSARAPALSITFAPVWKGRRPARIHPGGGVAARAGHGTTRLVRGAAVYWLEEAPPEPAASALAGEAEADVAIVGGGYTGLWTALALKQRAPELQVVVLEADVC